MSQKEIIKAFLYHMMPTVHYRFYDTWATISRVANLDTNWRAIGNQALQEMVDTKLVRIVRHDGQELLITLLSNGIAARNEMLYPLEFAQMNLNKPKPLERLKITANLLWFLLKTFWKGVIWSVGGVLIVTTIWANSEAIYNGKIMRGIVEWWTRKPRPTEIQTARPQLYQPFPDSLKVDSTTNQRLDSAKNLR